MKSIKNIKLLMFVGLLLHVGIDFARGLLDNLQRPYKKGGIEYREASGPTMEDFLAATRIDNLAAKGSREENIINAAKNGDHKNIATLIAPGVDLEAKDDQDRTALMRAAEKGYSDVVKILLDAGAYVSTKTKYGMTALLMAADGNHVEVVKLLIARGATSDECFRDVFVRAAIFDNAEMVKALVGEGAKISCDIIDEAYRLGGHRNIIIEHLKSQCNSSEIVD